MLGVVTADDVVNARRVVVLTLGYFAVATASVLFTRFEGGVAFLWAASALLLADLSNRPVREWSWRLIGCGTAGAAATTLFGLGAEAAIPLAFVNLAEAAGGALLLRRYVARPCQFESLPEIGRFLVIVGAVVPVACGMFAGWITHVVTDLPFLTNWLYYAAGHALGAITFTPLLLLMTGGEATNWVRRAGRRDWAEALTLSIAMAAVSALVFAQARFPLLFLPFLPMMVAVFRIGRLGAAASILILTVTAVTFTIDGTGPIGLIRGDMGLRAQFLQFYLAVAVLIVLPAAAELKRRKLLFGELQRVSAVSRLVLDRTGDIIMHLAPDGEIRYVSPSIQSIAGYDPADLLGTMPHAMMHEDDAPEAVRTHYLTLAAPNDTFIVEYRARRTDGSIGWFETHARATVDEAGAPTGVICIIREITHRKSVETRLAQEASTDPLTGIANRRAFVAAAERQLLAMEEHGSPACVALFDLDHFKSINDTFGHSAGDEVLKHFAALLQAALRRNDMVARFGGEEFVAILDGADLERAGEVCERLRARFSESVCMSPDGRQIRATISAGIAPLRAGISIDEALVEADAALYRAKREGRNRLALAA